MGISSREPARIALPSGRSWLASTHSRMSTSSRVPRMRAPISGCFRISFHSLSSSGPALQRIDPGRPTLPMSWRIPASRTRSARYSLSPSSRAIIWDSRRPAWNAWRCPNRAGRAPGEAHHRREVGRRVQGPPQGSAQHLLDLGAGDHGAVAAEQLRRVDRLLGELDQLLDGRRVGRVSGDPDARRQGHELVAEAAADAGQQLLGEQVRVGLLALGHDDRELGGPGPGDGVDPPGRLTEERPIAAAARRRSCARAPRSRP